jgi:hypothetical protein
VTADDLLLDALGRGDLSADDDEVAAMLAAWRADLDADDSTEPQDAEPEVAVVAPVIPIRRVRRLARIAVAAAAVLVLGGGLTVAAASGAKPGSPLWPITRVVFPGQADVAAAQHAIDLARNAAVEGRLDDARRLVDQADSLIARVRSPQDAERLRAELDDVRRMLGDAPANAPGGGSTTTTPAPGVTPAQNAPPTGGAGPGGGPGVGPGGGPGLPLPTNPGGGPGLPLPTNPGGSPGLPLPTLPPLPPLLPGGLPLPRQ